MNFERIDVDWSFDESDSSWNDAFFPTVGLRCARATLTRVATIAAEWRLCRLDVPGRTARVFVFPTLACDQPPASLWIANLRTAALERTFCLASDLWSEVVRAGWAGYDFNRIQDRKFSTSGGALDDTLHTSWQGYAASSGISEHILCTLPWDGLVAMWGAQAHQQAMSAREAEVLRCHIPPVASNLIAVALPKRRRDIKKV